MDHVVVIGDYIVEHNNSAESFPARTSTEIINHSFVQLLVASHHSVIWVIGNNDMTILETEAAIRHGQKLFPTKEHVFFHGLRRTNKDDQYLETALPNTNFISVARLRKHTTPSGSGLTPFGRHYLTLQLHQMKCANNSATEIKCHRISKPPLPKPKQRCPERKKKRSNSNKHQKIR